MSKRFTATEIWSEDWFLEMANEHKLFWYYMLSNCDHAGIFKINLRSFCSLLEVKVSVDEILAMFNSGKQRIRVVNQSIWYIEDFFSYQYGHTFNINNPLHRGVKKQLDKYEIEVSSIRGLKEVILTCKDKDKEIKKSILVDIGNGSIEEEDNGEKLLNNNFIAPKMIVLFRGYFPDYPIEPYKDLEASLEIAYKIAKWKGWKKNSVENGKLDDCLNEWRGIVEFVKKDKNWFAKKSIAFLNDNFQNLIQSKNSNDGTTNQFVVGKDDPSKGGKF